MWELSILACVDVSEHIPYDIRLSASSDNGCRTVCAVLGMFRPDIDLGRWMRGAVMKGLHCLFSGLLSFPYPTEETETYYLWRSFLDKIKYKCKIRKVKVNKTINTGAIPQWYQGDTMWYRGIPRNTTVNRKIPRDTEKYHRIPKYCVVILRYCVVVLRYCVVLFPR